MENNGNCSYTNLSGISRVKDDLDQRTKHQPAVDGAFDPLRPDSSRPVRVGIVGAGFAGLRCADILIQHGCDVTIFEARNRVGGRVAQSDQLGHTVDLGPNWIHGTNDNPILRLAKETHTALHGMTEDEAIIDPAGNFLSPEETTEYGALLWDDGLIAEAFRYSNEHQDAIDANVSLYDFFVQKAEQLFLEEPPDSAKRKRETFLLATRMWGAYVGSPVERQSLRFFWLEECIEGENPFVAGTYGKILDAVAAPAKRGSTIKLNTIVDRVRGGTQDAHANLRTADGDIHVFDEVVVTVPLGWLKQHHHTVFDPPLPQRLRQAVENIGYGTLDKVYIIFPSAFWDTSPHLSTSAKAFDPNSTTPNVTATATPLHQPSTNAKTAPAHYPSFTHWLAPTYAPDTNPSRFEPQGMNLAALPPGCAHPTLLFYIYGDCSKHIASLVSTSSSPSQRDSKLLAFFEPYYSRLPNYDPSDQACRPKAVLATAWANDEFAGYGSYANFQVGLEKGDEDIEVMRHGMPERRIWLAGEHTAPFIALGTTTGAYWSGEGVAERIVKVYGLEARGEEARVANGVK